MEILFIKIVFIGFFITCVTVFYEEALDFMKLQAYGNPYWLNISQLNETECSCDGEKTRNCYPHTDDSTLCGKCFSACPEPEMWQTEEHDKLRTNDLVFALSASLYDVNRLLVLIASIHRNFPTTKLIIFDLANGTALENQLISIRNVEVMTFKNRKLCKEKSASTPFYLKEILSNYSTVLWLAHDLEILNTKLMQAGPFRRSSKPSVTYISHEKRRKVMSPGYRPYFPSSSLMPHFPLVILLKNEAKHLIRWVEKCALTPECWKCDTSSGETEDCTWMILHQVASDAQQFRYFEDTNRSVNKQMWGPPECDFYCTMWLIGVTVIVVVSFGILALILLKQSTKKKV